MGHLKIKLKRLPITISLFRSTTDTQPTHINLSPTEFRDFLATPVSTKKKSEVRCWSPTRYEEGLTRKQSAVREVTALVLDLDDEHDIKRLEAHWRTRNLTYYVHSTWSHDPKAGVTKHRVVFPLKKPVPGKQWKATFAKLVPTLTLGYPVDQTFSSCCHVANVPSYHPKRESSFYANCHVGSLLDPTRINSSTPLKDPPKAKCPSRFPQREKDPHSDGQVLEAASAAKNASRFRELYYERHERGSTTRSEDDLQLCSMLAFYCGSEGHSQVDRLFRRSARLRKKWDQVHSEDGRTYGEMTVAKAYQGKTEFCTPREPGSRYASSNSSNSLTRRDWPAPIAEDAYHGLAGDIIRLVEPNTEADPAAILLQLLAAFGNVVGPSAFFEVEASKHRCVLYVALVGRTASGRKGTSWNYVRRLFEETDGDWFIKRVRDGLSTGEGLINAVRDPGKRTVKTKNGVREVELAGILDKRLAVIEPEFARVLVNTDKKDNTLGMVLRNSWDGSNVSTMTRHEPLRATQPHITVIGHITERELKRHFSDTQVFNGFGNRFLWVCVQRQRLLPNGGNVPVTKFQRLQQRLQKAVTFGRHAGQLTRDGAAQALWESAYTGVLATEKPGTYGAITERSAPQVLRLSMVYALLDSSNVIQEEHLRAALAVWDYCDRSAAYIFSDITGDPHADRIYRYLMQHPEATKTSIQKEVFRNNLPKERLHAALNYLRESGLAVSEHRRVAKSKGLSEYWFLAGARTNELAVTHG